MSKLQSDRDRKLEEQERLAEFLQKQRLKQRKKLVDYYNKQWQQNPGGGVAVVQVPENVARQQNEARLLGELEHRIIDLYIENHVDSRRAWDNFMIKYYNYDRPFYTGHLRPDAPFEEISQYWIKHIDDLVESGKLLGGDDEEGVMDEDFLPQRLDGGKKTKKTTKSKKSRKARQSKRSKTRKHL